MTVTVIGLDVTEAGEAQEAVEVITQETLCPLVRVELMNIGLLVPTFVVPTFH